MATTRDKRLTLREFLALPETEPAREYIDGRVVQKVSPKTKHAMIQLRLGSALLQALPADLCPASEMRCTFAGRSVVPDLVVFRCERIPKDASGEYAEDVFEPPDFAVEIVSPEQNVSVLVEKLSFYVANGVRLGWLIDLKHKTVMLFRPEREPEEVPLDGVLDDQDVLPGFHLPVAEMFKWVRPSKRNS